MHRQGPPQAIWLLQYRVAAPFQPILPRQPISTSGAPHHMLPLIFGVQDTRYSKLYQLKSLSSARTCSDAKMSTVYNWRPPWEPSALWSHNLGMIRPRHKSSPSLYLAFPFSSIIFLLLDFFSLSKVVVLTQLSLQLASFREL